MELKTLILTDGRRNDAMVQQWLIDNATFPLLSVEVITHRQAVERHRIQYDAYVRAHNVGDDRTYYEVTMDVPDGFVHEIGAGCIKLRGGAGGGNREM